jgi:hypothetical protein
MGISKTNMANAEPAPAETEVEKHGVRVGLATANDLDSWDDYVSRSPHGSVYHRLDALRVQAKHSGATLYPLVGFKGQEPLGLLPVFALSRAGITAVFSPPPNLWVSYLGPALINFEGLKQRRKEKRHHRFVDAAVEWIDEVVSPRYVHLRTQYEYDDPRPFIWNDFELTPRYTYLVDLTPSEDDLLSSFSSDARRNIRTDEDAYSIEEAGPAGVRQIIEQVRSRHEEQGEAYRVTPEFVNDLRDRLPEGRVRPYVCRIDGEFVGGMITLTHGDTVHRWQGGAKTDSDVPVNDLIDWRIMRDAKERGYERYNLVGANNDRLCGYKSKFSPSVAEYYSLERSSLQMRVAARLYNRFIK